MSEDKQNDVASNEKNIDVNNRRATLKKIGLAVPAIITLSSRPAYGAGFCSLSGFASVTASGVLRHENQSCGGYSQGGWKTPYGNGDGNWASDAPGCIPNPISEDKLVNLKKLIDAWDVDGGITILAGRANPAPTPFYSGSTFSLGTNVIPVDWPSGLIFTLHDALLYGEELAREAAAAFLNAKGQINNFNFTVDQVRDLFKDGQALVNGVLVPSPALTDAEFIALFKAAQH